MRCKKALSRTGDESGMALVMVIGVTAVLAAFVIAAVSVGVFSQRNARGSQDTSAAMSAAYAGVEEYQSRLANDTTYFQYGNPSASFSSASTVALPPADAANPAFGLGTSGTWAKVPGSAGAAEFRYEVDNSKYMAAGTLRIRSTGRAGGETRTIVADLKQTAFIDYLYFTDYEIMDPDVSGASKSCVQYYYAGRSSSCSTIQFGGNDTLNGKVHSNDAMRICDARFKGTVTTAYKGPAGGVNYLKMSSNGSSCSGATFDLGSPTAVAAIQMPETNSELKREVRKDLADVPRPGCLYTGPTTITLKSTGEMVVRSPWTRATQISGSPANKGFTPAECGQPGTSKGELGHADGATVDVPENNVVYVQNVPGATSDPNYPDKDGTTCKSADGSTSGNGLGFPIKDEVAPRTDSYGCKAGDVFVRGDMNGRMTIAAENYIYLTGDVKYVDRDDDVLGLIGNNAVWIWNPVDQVKSGKTTTWKTMLSDSGRTIDAAIMSVAHTIQVQNYDKGSKRGVLNISGSLIQKFRGTVGTTGSGGTGYTKNYMYDERYLYLAPPKFLNPVETTYGVTRHAEVEPAFDVDGS